MGEKSVSAPSYEREALPLSQVAISDGSVSRIVEGHVAHLPFRFIVKITRNSNADKGILKVKVFDASGKPLQGFPQVIANPLTKTGDSSRKDFEIPVTEALRKAIEKTLLAKDQFITYIDLIIGMDDDFLSLDFPKPTPTPPSASPSKTHHHRAHHKKSTAPEASPSPQETSEATPTAPPVPKPTGSEATLPTFFPPKATATVTVPLHLIKDGISLGELAERLGRVMDSVGYVEKSFYSLDAVDNKGCAIVTHIEQIKDDGTPVAKGRWSFDLPNYANFSVQTFLAALFTAHPGYYRLIALVVSEKPLVEKPNPISPSQAEELIHGPKSPPPSLWTIPVTRAYRCIAYIYEFERPTRSDDPAFMKDSPDVTAQTHLASTGLWAALQKEY